jgi:signal transduction histidine kinase
VSAQEFLSYVSQAIFLALFVVTTVRVVRRPSWAAFDTFLFFAIIAAILLAGDVADILGFAGHPTLSVVNWVGISALPFILLRLVDDFRPQPMWVMALATLSWAGVALLGILTPQPWGLVSLVVVVFVVALGLYASLAFLREARRSSGVTQRRMQAVAIGSGLLAVVLFLAGVNVVFPDASPVIGMLNQVISLALVLAYFVGFAPPAFLRRSWQEPTLRALLAEAAQLVQLPDSRTIARRIEDRAVAVTGGDGARVGIWDEQAGVLVFDGPDGERRIPPGDFIAGRSFQAQAPLFSGRAERDAPEHAAEYRATGIQAIAASPITSGDHRLGVLVVYAARPPLFTDDVLGLVGLIAEQAALVLRSHQLLREAAQVRAMAEMTRLKDDFLSVVAHDVRTPLTTILLNAELLEQTMDGDSSNARRASSLRTEALRLKQLVEDYLDVVRADEARVARREPADLVILVREAIDGMGQDVGRVSFHGDASVEGGYDAPRIHQLVQNLVSNALKYSEPDDPVEVAVRGDGADAIIEVTDHGIGIPDDDQAMLFERFHRGQNTDDRRYGGLGLGLYICKQIAEEHRGSVSVTSRLGEGSTFGVRLRRWAVTDEVEQGEEVAP